MNKETSQGGRGATQGKLTQLTAPPPTPPGRDFDSKVLSQGRGFAMAAILEDHFKRTLRERKFDFY